MNNFPVSCSVSKSIFQSRTPNFHFASADQSFAPTRSGSPIPPSFSVYDKTNDITFFPDVRNRCRLFIRVLRAKLAGSYAMTHTDDRFTHTCYCKSREKNHTYNQRGLTETTPVRSVGVILLPSGGWSGIFLSCLVFPKVEIPRIWVGSVFLVVGLPYCWINFSDSAAGNRPEPNGMGFVWVGAFCRFPLRWR